MDTPTKGFIKNLSSKKPEIHDVDEVKISDITNRQSQIIQIETETGPVHHFRMVGENGLFEVERPRSKEIIQVTLIGSFKKGERVSTTYFMTSRVTKISLITLL